MSGDIALASHRHDDQPIRRLPWFEQVSKPDCTPRARIGRSLIDSSASSATDRVPS